MGVVIFVLSVILFPLICYKDYKLKRKLQLYKKVIAAQIILISLSMTMDFNEYLREGNILIFCLILMYFLVMITSPYLIINSKRLGEEVKSNFIESNKSGPVSTEERIFFAILSVFVGVGEELVYRVVIPGLFVDLGVSILWAFIISSIIFGAQHIYQGAGGALHSTITGLMLSYLYIFSGTIIVPIVIHILLDLKAVLISKIIFKNKPSL